VDATGNSYVHGIFTGTATFGTNILISRGADDIFLAKYDTDGNLLWIQQAGGPGNEDDFGGAIALHTSGNIYIGGSYLLNATFGGITLTNSGDHDLYIAKYNNAGTLLYAQSGGGTDYDYCRGIGVDRNGNCYLTGRFSGAASLGSLNLTSTGVNDLFVAKLAAFSPGNELRLVPHYTNGIASISILALPGQSVAIEAADELAKPAPWNFLTNVTLLSSPYFLLDGSSINQSNRLYRARLAP
jgi:hypothetical protein